MNTEGDENVRETERKTLTQDTILASEKQYTQALCCGRATALRIAKDAGAIVKVGRRTLYHMPRIREYLEQVRQG